MSYKTVIKNRMRRNADDAYAERLKSPIELNRANLTYFANDIFKDAIMLVKDTSGKSFIKLKDNIIEGAEKAMEEHIKDGKEMDKRFSQSIGAWGEEIQKIAQEIIEEIKGRSTTWKVLRIRWFDEIGLSGTEVEYYIDVYDSDSGIEEEVTYKPQADMNYEDIRTANSGIMDVLKDNGTGEELIMVDPESPYYNEKMNLLLHVGEALHRVEEGPLHDYIYEELSARMKSFFEEIDEDED